MDNYDFLTNSETNMILSKITTIFSSCKEISSNLILYYTNFKILLEKSKVKPPFLGPITDPKKNFTLVVDLDETLVHYVEEESRAYVQVRPYADYFLTEMGKHFEIVIFTAAAEDYADIPNKADRLRAIRQNPYFNALQVKFSYALTCHKTQGGLWDTVIIDQGYINEEMLDREYLRWLYTAITRATQKVYLLNFEDNFFDKDK